MKKDSSSSLSEKTGRLADHVAHQLIITTRQMAFGAKLPSENQLAKQFGVSRSVVREAISQLKSLNAVESRQGAGMFVARPSAKSLEFRDIDTSNLATVAKFLEIRSGLDAAAARIAATRRTEEQLQFIREASKRSTLPELSMPDAVEADLAFHVAIVQATRNEYFLAVQTFLVSHLRDGIIFTRNLESYSPAMVEEIRQEHAAIVQAIAERNAAEASRRAELHVLNAQRRMRTALAHLLPDIA